MLLWILHVSYSVVKIIYLTLEILTSLYLPVGFPGNIDKTM